MSRKEDGGAAFPQTTTEYYGGVPDVNVTGGLSVRDAFAMAALTGMGTWMPPHGGDNLSTMQAMDARALWAYEQADAMLRARRDNGEREDG